MAPTGTKGSAMPLPRLARRAVPALLLLGLGAAGRAHAHAEVLRSTPADGAVLATPPTEVELVFTGPMQVSAIRLFDAGGREIALRREGSRTARVTAIRATVQGPALAPGAYRIDYRGISEDGHVGGGSVHFRLGGGTAR